MHSSRKLITMSILAILVSYNLEHFVWTCQPFSLLVELWRVTVREAAPFMTCVLVKEFCFHVKNCKLNQQWYLIIHCYYSSFGGSSLPGMVHFKAEFSTLCIANQDFGKGEACTKS